MKIDLTFVGLAAIVWALTWMNVENAKSADQVKLAQLHCVGAVK